MLNIAHPATMLMLTRSREHRRSAFCDSCSLLIEAWRQETQRESCFWDFLRTGRQSQSEQRVDFLAQQKLQQRAILSNSEAAAEYSFEILKPQWTFSSAGGSCDNPASEEEFVHCSRLEEDQDVHQVLSNLIAFCRKPASQSNNLLWLNDWMNEQYCRGSAAASKGIYADSRTPRANWSRSQTWRRPNSARSSKREEDVATILAVCTHMESKNLNTQPISIKPLTASTSLRVSNHTTNLAVLSTRLASPSHP